MRLYRKGLMASSLKELVQRGELDQFFGNSRLFNPLSLSIIHFSEARDKFSIDPWVEVYLVLEEDGTEVDEEEYFQVAAIYDHHQQLKLGMSEKLCLQWNDFRENVDSAFKSLRNDKKFTDVTLACEDGQQIEAHKIILAASSPFFEKILHKSKHPHPLIYLRGIRSKHFRFRFLPCHC